MSFETIKYEIEGGIATITINRPEVLNALNLQVLRDIIGAVGEARLAEDVKVVILTGEGRSFVAGADIAQMKNFSATEALEFADLGHEVMRQFETLPKPVIAAVNGFALGGGTEIALGCDFIYASSKAKFGQPEVNLGIIPGFGGTQRLARSVGANVARELIFTGSVIDAAQAKRIGLVCEVFEPEALMEKVREKANLLQSVGPLAIAAAKRAMDKGMDMALDAACELEKQTFVALFGTEDQKEGMTAFVEKRKPSFKTK